LIVNVDFYGYQEEIDVPEHLTGYQRGVEMRASSTIKGRLYAAAACRLFVKRHKRRLAYWVHSACDEELTTRYKKADPIYATLDVTYRFHVGRHRMPGIECLNGNISYDAKADDDGDE
jgi:hypothetical protein